MSARWRTQAAFLGFAALVGAVLLAYRAGRVDGFRAAPSVNIMHECIATLGEATDALRRCRTGSDK